MKRFGASGGVALRQATIKSPRTTVSSSKAIRPSARDTTWMTVAPGRRCKDVTAKRQPWCLKAPRRVFSDLMPSQPARPNRAKPPRKPAAVSSASFTSPACHKSSTTKATMPRP